MMAMMMDAPAAGEGVVEADRSYPPPALLLSLPASYRVIYDIPHTRRGVCTPVEIAVGAGVVGNGTRSTGGVSVIRALLYHQRMPPRGLPTGSQDGPASTIGPHRYNHLWPGQQAFQLLPTTRHFGPSSDEGL